MNTYALKTDKHDEPLTVFEGTKYGKNTYYNILLTSFGLGPFSYDEAIGALSTHTNSREKSKVIFQNLVYLNLVEYVG